MFSTSFSDQKKRKILKSIRRGQSIRKLAEELKLVEDHVHEFVASQYYDKAGHEAVTPLTRQIIADLIFRGKGNREISNQLLIRDTVIQEWRQALEPKSFFDNKQSVKSGKS